MTRRSTRSGVRGFTLLELMVVIAMVAVVAAVATHFVVRIREAAHRATSQQNLRDITLAAVKGADDQQGFVPRADWMSYPNADVDPKTRKPKYNSIGSCFWHILPNLQQRPLWQSTRDDNDGVSVAVETPLKIFIAPGDPTNACDQPRTSYLANPLAFGDDSCLGVNEYHRYPASYTDGTSQTIGFAEGYSIAGKTSRHWHDGSAVWSPGGAVAFQLRPPRTQAVPSLPQGFSRDAIQVGMLDGSVKHVTSSTTVSVFNASCTIDAGDVMGCDW